MKVQSAAATASVKACIKTLPGCRPSLLSPLMVLLSSIELNVCRSMPVRSISRCVVGCRATGPRARSASAALLSLWGVGNQVGCWESGGV